jgi:hypothetical protein
MRTRKSAHAETRTTRVAERTRRSERPAGGEAPLKRQEMPAQLTLGLVAATRPSRAALPPCPAALPTGMDAPRTVRLTPAAGTAHAGGVAGATDIRRHFGELRDALADGWEIVQPIFARPLWSALDDSATAFNFVLSGPRGTKLITVPQGRTVERFIRDRHLRVDYAR